MVCSSYCLRTSKNNLQHVWPHESSKPRRIKMTSESNRLPKMLFYLFVCRPALICNVCIVEYDHENLHDQYLYILDVRFDLSNYTVG